MIFDRLRVFRKKATGEFSSEKKKKTFSRFSTYGKMQHFFGVKKYYLGNKTMQVIHVTGDQIGIALMCATEVHKLYP